MALTDAQLTAAAASDASNPVALGGGPTTAQLRVAIVLRGYLEDPGLTTGGTKVWRIDLTPRRDVFVNFLASDALRVVTYVPLEGSSLPGAVTLFLAGQDDNCCAKQYFISRPLGSGFLAGALVEDFLSSQDAQGATYPEQG